MTMTRDSERSFFVNALRARYGFGPAECEVHIIESSGDGGHIAAEIGGKSYILENLYKLNGEDIYDDLRAFFDKDLFSEEVAR